jgi:hypothetical protein
MEPKMTTRNVHARLNKRAAGRLALALSLVLLLPGCESMAIAAFGVGSSTAVSHTLNGITYRTFTAPLPRVKTATVGALNKMGIKVTTTGKQANSEVLNATANDRSIEIELEPISSGTTRMRVIARSGGLFYDSATASEIILQTERLLGNA